MAKRVIARYIGKRIYCNAFPFKGMKLEGTTRVPTGGLVLDDKTKQADIESLLKDGRIAGTNTSVYDNFFEEVEKVEKTTKPGTQSIPETK